MIRTPAVLALLSQARKQWTFRGPLVDLPLATGRKEAVAAALMFAREKRRAAEVLYAADCPAEALRVAVQALQAATAVIEAAAEREPGSASRTAQIQSALQAWGVRPEMADRFPELVADVSSGQLPATDGEVTARDLERFDELLRACWAVETAFDGVTRTRPQRVGWRVARVLVPIALGALLALGIWLTSLELQPRVTAHGTWAQRVSQMGPHFVIDRDPKTEWVPPDGGPGWLELRFVRRRDVRSIVLRNGNNRGIRDRATRDYRIELYRGERLLAQTGGSFASIEPSPVPVVVAVEARRVDRVRVLIDSFHGFGAALAEVGIH